MTPPISLLDALRENERLRLQVARLTDENALRFEDPSLASELLNIVCQK